VRISGILPSNAMAVAAVKKIYSFEARIAVFVETIPESLLFTSR
jgi:hypothetical protein